MTSTIDQIRIDQDLPGFDPFFASWLVRTDKTFIVDTGPAASAHRLIASLEGLGVDRLDYVLLTHIHIDHAGALAAILKRYPEATAVCHGGGLKFLTDPGSLWAGSRKVLGDLAEAYGRPEPIPAARLISHEGLSLPGWTIVETPGHAPHHLCYSLTGQALFAGEAAGNYFRTAPRDYLRPSTPPRFFLKVALDSLEKLKALPDQPIYYAHVDWAESSRRILARFREQCIRWADIISLELLESRPDPTARCVEALFAKDPELAAFRHMDAPTQARERRFMANSIGGFLGHLGGEGKA